MEAVRTSETSVKFNVTIRRYISKDSKLHTRRRENLKSHMLEITSEIATHLRTIAMQTTCYAELVDTLVTFDPTGNYMTPVLPTNNSAFFLQNAVRFTSFSEQTVFFF
jgi:hypothetical protein